MITKTARLEYLSFVENLEFQWPILVQARIHRRRRINKKWAKRYGSKTVPLKDAWKYKRNQIQRSFVITIGEI